MGVQQQVVNGSYSIDTNWGGRNLKLQRPILTVFAMGSGWRIAYFANFFLLGLDSKKASRVTRSSMDPFRGWARVPTC